VTLYIDLDGPLLDVSRRYHAVYRSILALFGDSPIDQDAYWRLKRAGRRETEICATMHPGIDPAKYLRRFLERIEEPSYLASDRSVEGAGRTLAALRGRHRLVLATLRRRGAAMRAQLADLGLLDFFDLILQAEANDGSWRTKAEMIAAERGFDRKESLLVGDTEGDVLAALRVGIPALGVRNGLRDPGVLAEAGPCFLIETIEGLPGRIEGLRQEREKDTTRRERSCARS
jgi:phosphoglycolate phosphatase